MKLSSSCSESTSSAPDQNETDGFLSSTLKIRMKKEMKLPSDLEVASLRIFSINICWLANTKEKLIIDAILFVSNHVVNTIWNNSRLQSLMWLQRSFLRRSRSGEKSFVNILRKFQILSCKRFAQSSCSISLKRVGT